MTERAFQIPGKAGPCVHPEPGTLAGHLTDALGKAGLPQDLRDSHPHVFSSSSVFVSPDNLARMQAVIEAVETVVASPGYRHEVLGRSNPAARHDPRCPGAALGYDFHFGPDGPRLIEVNTNAGGGLLALAVLRANLVCCPPLLEQMPGHAGPEAIENSFAAMFVEEWRAVHTERPLHRLAIVDDSPTEQFLHPEFVLFRELFRRHGIEAVIADPADLHVVGGILHAGDHPVDLVYNRLTDFTLEEPAHAVLRRAYLENIAVVTPHPRAHALYAEKNNLSLFTDPSQLRAFGVAEPVIEILQQGVAHTRRVLRAEADRLWDQRKRLFFKPLSGYGSRAVYRGDKLTRRVWDEILASDYVAQELVPPAEQAITRETDETRLKYDVRNFVYRGSIQMLAARLYQGQTTNFRTPGGGFAPVFRVREETTA